MMQPPPVVFNVKVSHLSRRRPAYFPLTSGTRLLPLLQAGYRLLESDYRIDGGRVPQGQAKVDGGIIHGMGVGPVHLDESEMG